MNRSIVIVIAMLNISYAFNQTCEEYDKTLFHLLSETPEKINCTDTNGYKQGLWIYYKVEYNSINNLDDLPAGNYIPEFYYGHYLNNNKIGTWIKVLNVHLICEFSWENFYYNTDTVLITSNTPSGTTITYYNRDSTIINSICISKDYTDSTFIRCYRNFNPSDSACKIIFKNKIITTFPFNNFEIELDKCNSSFYLRDKKKINSNYR